MAFPDGWQRRVPIAIPAAKVTGSHSGFPVLLTGDCLPDEIWAEAQNGGGDLRVTTDQAGTTRLPLEVVDFTTATETAQLWVRLPLLSGETTIYLWWGTDTTESQPAVTDPFGRNAVWSADLARLHLNQAATDTADAYTDSTGHGYHGTGVSMSLASLATPYGAPAAQFDGSADYIALPDSLARRDWSGGLTWSAWAKPDSLSTDQRVMSVWGGSNADQLGLFWMDADGGGKGWAGQIKNSAGGGTVTVGENNSDASTGWQLIHMTWDGSALKVYVNGAATASGSASYPSDKSGTNAIFRLARLGSLTGSANYFDGALAEIGIAGYARSADWIAAEYANQSDPASFAIPGAVEDVGGGGADDLSAIGLDILSAVGTPSLSQLHGLVALGIDAGCDVGLPSLSQAHGLAALGVDIDADLGLPDVGQGHALSATGLSVTSDLGTPDIGQRHALSAWGLDVAADLGSPTFAQEHGLAAVGLDLPSLLGLPALSTEGTDALQARGLSIQGEVGQPAVGQEHQLSALGIASDILVGRPAIGEVGSLSAIGLDAVPDVGLPTLAEDAFALSAVGLDAAADVGVPAMGHEYHLQAMGVDVTVYVGLPGLDVALPPRIIVAQQYSRTLTAIRGERSLIAIRGDRTTIARL